MTLRSGWLAAAAAWAALGSGAPAWAADDGRGAELFELCVQCHGGAGEGNSLALAPAIAGLPQWYLELQIGNFREGIRGLHPHDVGGLRMHPMSKALRGDEEVRAVVAHVASLPPTYPAPTLEGGDPQRGQQLYVTCQACHGPAAEGVEAVGGPALKLTNDWYLLTQLANYKAGVRGTKPEDAAGMRMRPLSLVLPDEQAMKDVIAYIMTLRP
jgi:cytochrome c553